LSCKSFPQPKTRLKSRRELISPRDAFDPDVKHLVKVKIVHGSWKTEDSRRIRLEEAAKRYGNVQLITAYMPEAFGTHHTKMMILLRHDDTAQVIIHTANMISRDWANLCQAVWRSPLLPLIPEQKAEEATTIPSSGIGTGERFKVDLLRYLKAYQGRTAHLVEQLKLYDFSAIRAALIASTPSRVRVNSSNTALTSATSWGWPGMREILRTVPCSLNENDTPSIVLQTSSIATIPEKWTTNFFEILASRRTQASPFFASSKANKPRVSIIFPTADEIRRSLDGYEAGASIHTKIQSAAQVKQLSLLRPMLCHWAGDHTNPIPEKEGDEKGVEKREALRRRAAPHIKTYIRFSSAAQTEIEWALLTSANLSQQAWGAMPDKEGSVRICSYELGVVVWPALFTTEGEEMKMLPVFRKDLPDKETPENERNPAESTVTRESSRKRSLIGFRMPYDLPLVPYAQDEVPWCATANHTEPDWKGVVYGAYVDS
jgi:tyrosyl-DNA phosphodiesterase-1